MKAAEGTTGLAAERSGVVAPMIGVGAQAAYRHLWVELFFKGSEQRKVTIFLGLSIMLAPVIGSRPLRSFFVLTQNLPNPLIRTSSPEARLALISSIRVSTSPSARLEERFSSTARTLAIKSFVTAPPLAPRWRLAMGLRTMVLSQMSPFQPIRMPSSPHCGHCQ